MLKTSESTRKERKQRPLMLRRVKRTFRSGSWILPTWRWDNPGIQRFTLDNLGRSDKSFVDGAGTFKKVNLHLKLGVTLFFQSARSVDETSVHETSHNHFHWKCHGDTDRTFTADGFIKPTPHPPYTIEFICEGCDDDERAKHLSDDNTIGEITLVNDNKMSMDVKRTGYTLELDRLQ
jgi:hypothetical protein